MFLKLWLLVSVKKTDWSVYNLHMQVIFLFQKGLFWNSLKSCWIKVTICVLTSITVDSVRGASTYSKEKLFSHALLLSHMTHTTSMHKNSLILYRHSDGVFSHLEWMMYRVGKRRSPSSSNLSRRSAEKSTTRSLCFKIPQRQVNRRPYNHCTFCYSERNVRKQTYLHFSFLEPLSCNSI